MAEVRNLQQLLTLLQIDTWNYLIIGDGSAMDWAHQCGWGALVIENQTMKRDVYYGCMNHGTNNVGELMASLGPLLHISARKDRQKEASDGGTYVHVVTDSAYVQKAGNRHVSRKANQPLWAMLDQYNRMGILVKFHWVPRDTLKSQHLGHLLANGIRMASKITDGRRVGQSLNILGTETAEQTLPDG